MQLAQDAVAPGFAAVEAPEVDTDTLCLVEVSIAGSSGPSMHPPAIRVTTSSVTAWWLTDHGVRAVPSGSDLGVGIGMEFSCEV